MCQELLTLYCVCPNVSRIINLILCMSECVRESIWNVRRCSSLGPQYITSRRVCQAPQPKKPHKDSKSFQVPPIIITNHPPIDIPHTMSYSEIVEFFKRPIDDQIIIDLLQEELYSNNYALMEQVLEEYVLGLNNTEKTTLFNNISAYMTHKVSWSVLPPKTTLFRAKILGFSANPQTDTKGLTRTPPPATFESFQRDFTHGTCFRSQQLL